MLEIKETAGVAIGLDVTITLGDKKETVYGLSRNMTDILKKVYYQGLQIWIKLFVRDT